MKPANDATLQHEETTGAYGEVSTPQVHARIAKETEEQERQLDAILGGAKRLKGAACANNEEVVAQNQMIDAISLQMTDADEAVTEQTEAAKKVTKSRRSLCVFYVIIGLQIAALIVVIAI